MNSYIPLHVHTHYSLLDGLSKPEQIAKRCCDLNIESCAITDHGTISGNVQFYQKMSKEGIKPILGIELYICKESAKIQSKDNSKLSHMLILCKNIKAWRELIKIVSKSNSKEYFYHKPRISLSELSEYSLENFICMTGHPGSVVSNDILCQDKLNSDAVTIAKSKIDILKEMFGKNNVFIEAQLMDRENCDSQKLLTNFYRENKSLLDINLVASIDAHYANKTDAVDQRILLCNNLKTTIPNVTKKLLANEDFGLKTFFKSDNFYILSNEEMSLLHTEEELGNTHLINQMCENFNILDEPRLPPFKCPGDYTEAEYLKKITYQKILENNLSETYKDRLDYELNVLMSANLSGYFLIVKDIVDFIKDNKWLPGPGRGSAAGALVSYLLGITTIDPIKYDLIFERFYNAGRNVGGRISMPDIDVDVPIEKRELVIEHIKNMYGENKVSQMITYNTLKGRGALKEVLRVYDTISFDEMNKITENIPDEAKIADDLQEMKEEYGEASIIKWALENEGKKLKQWCQIKSDGSLHGPLSKRFEQAIRLEGVKCHQSKHAAGIAVSAQDLSSICPMVYDSKTGQTIAGMEMSDLESIGVIKFDILGVALLDKIMKVREFLAG
jgi:DNA polymerase-3 subunit alpha